MPGRRQHGEGSVYERGKRGGRGGQWVAVADLGRLPPGRRDRREFTGSTPKEAMDKRDRFLDRRRGGFTMPRGRQPYVSEWVLHWLHTAAKRKVAASTWERSYRQKVTGHIAPFFERVPLPELCEEDIEDWHSWLEGKISERTGRPLSPTTVQHCHRILSTAIKAAVARGKLPRNPVANVPAPGRPKGRPQPPTAAEVRRIMERCQTWPYGARWVVAIATGIRQGEALALRWRDVHLEDASPWILVNGTKSEAAQRAVPLAPVAVAALRAWRKEQVRDLRDDRVFTRPPRADWQDWQDLLTELGLPHYRVHDLRHGFATGLLEEGVDIKVVQVLIGHASPDFTRRVYQHVRPVLHKAAAEAMERYLRG